MNQPEWSDRCAPKESKDCFQMWQALKYESIYRSTYGWTGLPKPESAVSYTIIDYCPWCGEHLKL